MKFQSNIRLVVGGALLTSLATSPAMAGFPACTGDACKEYRTVRIASDCLGASNIGSRVIRVEYTMYRLDLQPGETEPYKILGSPPCIRDFGPGTSIKAYYIGVKADASKKGVWKKFKK